jgi:hypothetical protein
MDDDGWEWTVCASPFCVLFAVVLFGWIAAVLIAVVIVKGG